MRGTEQTVAAHTDSAEYGVEERATFIAAGELRGRLEEYHTNQGVLTKGDPRSFRVTLGHQLPVDV